MAYFRQVNYQFKKFAFEVRQKGSVDIIELFLIFWKTRVIIIFLMGLFVFIGLVRFATSPVMYSSTSKVLTEQAAPFAGGGLSSLPGMSGLGGLARGADNEVIPPDLYPELIINEEFLYDIVKDSFYFKEIDLVLDLKTFFSEYEEKDLVSKIVSFPRTVVSSLKGPTDNSPVAELDNLSQSDTTVIKLTPVENLAINRLAKRIDITKNGRMIEITTKMPDPVVATKLNSRLIEALKDFVVIKTTDRESQNLEFISNQTSDARNNFEKAQIRLATFRDENMGIVTQRAKTTEQRLQSEYDLSFQVYNNLAQQLEQAKFKLQEAKPVVTIFQNPKVPLGPSGPGMILTIVIFSLLGLFMGVIIVSAGLIKEFAKK